VQDTVVAELLTAALAACVAAHPGLETHLDVNLARVIARSPPPGQRATAPRGPIVAPF
jgi:hypothetical protein